MRYRDTRLPSGTDLRVEHGTQVSPGQIVNISTTGAKLRYSGGLAPEALVALCWLDMRVSARVVWSNHAMIGVRFVRPLSTKETTVLRGAVGGVGSWGPPRHEGLRELG